MVLFCLGVALLVGWIPVVLVRTEMRYRRYINEGVNSRLARRWAVARG